MTKDINTLRKENELIDLFCTLAEIPSPSGEEDKVAQKIVEILKSNGIEAKLDDFGNVRAKIPATNPNKKSLALSAHMDVVGDAADPAVRRIVEQIDRNLYLHVAAVYPSVGDVAGRMRKGDTDVAVCFERGYDGRLQHDGGASVRVLGDGSDPNTAQPCARSMSGVTAPCPTSAMTNP